MTVKFFRFLHWCYIGYLIPSPLVRFITLSVLKKCIGKKEILERVSEQFKTSSPRALTYMIRELILLDLSDALKRIKKPTLIISGKKGDSLRPLSTAIETERILRENEVPVELIVLDTGHYSPTEDSKGVAEAILSFISRTSKGIGEPPPAHTSTAKGKKVEGRPGWIWQHGDIAKYKHLLAVLEQSGPMATIPQFEIDANTDRAMREEIPGVDFEEWSAGSGHLSDEEFIKQVVAWMIELCGAVVLLNEAGLEHGDVGTINVVIDSRTNSPVLIDFFGEEGYNAPDFKDIVITLREALGCRTLNKPLGKAIGKELATLPSEIRKRFGRQYKDLLDIAYADYPSARAFMEALSAYTPPTARTSTADGAERPSLQELDREDLESYFKYLSKNPSLIERDLEYIELISRGVSAEDLYNLRAFCLENYFIPIYSILSLDGVVTRIQEGDQLARIKFIDLLDKYFILVKDEEIAQITTLLKARVLFASRIDGTMLVPAAMLQDKYSDMDSLRDAASEGYVVPISEARDAKGRLLFHEDGVLSKALEDITGLKKEPNIFLIPMASDERIDIHGRTRFSVSTPSYVFKGAGNRRSFNTLPGLRVFFGRGANGFEGGLLNYVLEPEILALLRKGFNALIKKSDYIEELASEYNAREDVFNTPEVKFRPLAIPATVRDRKELMAQKDVASAVIVDIKDKVLLDVKKAFSLLGLPEKWKPCVAVILPNF